MRNSKKSNTNWILCPSKSIPGKFYYFNVITGEAVWGDDTDGNTQKKEKNIYKVIDNSHVYPEPVNLPEEIQRKNIQKTIYSYANNQQNLNKPCPSFGQVMFPQYFPHSPSLMPGVMWTPIQMPIFSTCKEEKPMLDRYTQTLEFRDIIIQTCNISLSERFAMLGCNTDLESSKKKIFISSPLHPVNWWHKTTSVSNDDNKNMKQQCTRNKRTSILEEPKFKLPLKINEPKDNISNNNIETVNSSQCKEYIKESVDKEEDVFQNLDKTDLRHLLILKKQKTVDFSVSVGHRKEKDNKTVQNVPVKKKVTFNLDTMDDISDITINDNDNEIKPPMPIHLLRNLIETQNLTDNWYIITDMDVLLDNINFIIDYINGDDNCKLLVIKSILKIVENSGRGDGRRPQVLAARQTYRHILNYDKVEIIDMGKNMTLNDQIINCCLQGINEEKHIVLITKNTTLLERAKLFQIHAYNLDDIKNYNSESSKSVENIYIKKNTLQQKEDYHNLFVFNKSGNIYDNMDNQIEISNDNGSNDDNNDIFFNKNQDGKEDLSICREISNINRSIQKNDLNNSKKVSKLINSTFINRKIDNTTNNDQKSFKPLVFQKIFTNCETVFDQTDTFQDKVTDYERGDDCYYRNETNARQRNKEYGSSVFENFNQISDNRNNNKYTGKEKTKNKMGFHIKDKNMENNIVIRLNEYSCCYVQIMEEFINIVLENNIFVKHFMPCFFLEGLESLKEFCLDVNIKHVIHKLLLLWKKEDKLKKDTKPNDFMRLLEYGWLLIDLLKDFIPDAFKEIDYSYRKLLENIENPVVEDIEFIETPIRGCQDNINRNIFVKDKFEIVNYLKKHFSQWKDFEIPEQEKDLKEASVEISHSPRSAEFSRQCVLAVEFNSTLFSYTRERKYHIYISECDNNNYNKIQILRTSGKHLKSFKINNKKHITFSTNSENECRLKKNNSKTNKTEAPLIRNIKIVEEYEKNIKKSDLYLGFNETIESNLNIINDEVNDSLNNDVNLLNDNEINDRLINDDKLFSDNEMNDGLNDTTDSGFETEMHTTPFLQDFFVHLSCTLKHIFSFVDKCNNDLRDETIKEKDRNYMYERATQTCDHMNHIIDKLKSIIERESKETSKLKTLLIKTGQDVSEDKRITRYRQTVIKCLEQAQILNSCLKLILNTNKQNMTDDVSMNSYNVTYFNIFE